MNIYNVIMNNIIVNLYVLNCICEIQLHKFSLPNFITEPPKPILYLM